LREDTLSIYLDSFTTIPNGAIWFKSIKDNQYANSKNFSCHITLVSSNINFSSAEFRIVADYDTAIDEIDV
jgi:hypothetical protein